MTDAEDDTPGDDAEEIHLDLDVEEAFACPYCGEVNELEVDPLAGANQQFTQDCWICCRPILVSLELRAEDGGWRLDIEVDRELD